MNLKRSEVLSIIAVVVVCLLLGIVFLMHQRQASKQSQRIACVGNLKRIGLAFRIYSNAYGRDRFQMGYPEASFGAMDSVAAGKVWKVFQVMSNDLSLSDLICPADNRLPALAWTNLENQNLSYFVGADALDTRPNTILSGDRHIELSLTPMFGVVSLGTNAAPRWATNIMHPGEGNIGLSDGSVQRVNTEGLRQLLVNSGDSTNRLVFP